MTGDDPIHESVWHEWWEGNDPRVPAYLAHLMWWDMIEASDAFISPDPSWNPPDVYRITETNPEENATDKVELDLARYIRAVQSLEVDASELILKPYEFEDAMQQNLLLRYDYIGAFAAYVFNCYDQAITGLLTGNAALSTTALAYAHTGTAILYEYRRQQTTTSLKVARTKLSISALNVRHIGSRSMKKEAVRLYVEKSDWPSRRQASKAITPLVQAFGWERHQHKLSADRAEQTVYEWLTEHDRAPKQ